MDKNGGQLWETIIHNFHKTVDWEIVLLLTLNSVCSHGNNVITKNNLKNERPDEFVRTSHCLNCNAIMQYIVLIVGDGCF